MSKSEQIGPMSKSEQGGGGGTETTPRKEPKPKQKRPWIKPRVRLVEFAKTKAYGVQPGSNVYVEGLPGNSGGLNISSYDPNLS